MDSMLTLLVPAVKVTAKVTQSKAEKMPFFNRSKNDLKVKKKIKFQLPMAKEKKKN